MTHHELPQSVQAALNELKQALMQLYGKQLHGLYLYGSYARGTAHNESDVDVLVVLAGSIKPGAEITRMSPAVSAICLRYDLLISVYPISAEWFETHHDPFLEMIRRDTVAL